MTLSWTTAGDEPGLDAGGHLMRWLLERAAAAGEEVRGEVAGEAEEGGLALWLQEEAEIIKAHPHEAAALFRRTLRRLRMGFGNPSYREIVVRSHFQLSAPTLSRMLRPDGPMPPWRPVEAFLEAMDVDVEELGLWRWFWAFAAGKTADHPEAPRQELPQPTECDECGALVTNWIRHRTWHQDIDARSTEATRKKMI